MRNVLRKKIGKEKDLESYFKVYRVGLILASMNHIKSSSFLYTLLKTQPPQEQTEPGSARLPEAFIREGDTGGSDQ